MAGSAATWRAIRAMQSHTADPEEPTLTSTHSACPPAVALPLVFICFFLRDSCKTTCLRKLGSAFLSSACPRRSQVSLALLVCQTQMPISHKQSHIHILDIYACAHVHTHTHTYTLSLAKGQGSWPTLATESGSAGHSGCEGSHACTGLFLS